MIFRILFTISLICFNGIAQEEKLSLIGYYQGVNLLISNPAQNDGFGYCIYKVTVNGEILPATTQKNIFEIDFNLFNIKKEDPVFIVLEHTSGCTPKFLNPESLKSKSTFKCNNINVNQNGIIEWETIGESGKLDFVIEQYRWDKWVEEGKVLGKGLSGPNKYKFKLNLHSGMNRIRIAQYDNTNTGRFSNEVYVESNVKEVFLSTSMVKDSVRFLTGKENVKSKFVIHDAYGNLLKVGVGETVDCSNLVNGVYYMSFDNKTEKFFKIN